ncbi:hypothetical protein HZA97_01215 [Candidatus Woesearchaeota archaeon]|nr:hypothetical protein [Candidatus Woesearchaeota archaeon]
MVKVNYDLLSGEQKDELSFYGKMAVSPGKNIAGRWLSQLEQIAPGDKKTIGEARVIVKNLSGNLDKLLADLGLSFVEVQELAAQVKKEAKARGLTETELGRVTELLDAKVTEYGQLKTQYGTEVQAKEAAEKAKVALEKRNGELDSDLVNTTVELEQANTDLERLLTEGKELAGQYKAAEKAKTAVDRKVARLETRRDELKGEVSELKAQSREQTKEAKKLYSEREALTTQVAAQTQVSSHYENNLRQVLVDYLGVSASELDVPAHMDVSQVLTQKLTEALQAQAQFRADLSAQAEEGLRELSVLSGEEVQVGKGKNKKN